MTNFELKEWLFNNLGNILAFVSALANIFLTWKLGLVSKFKEIKFINYHKDQIDKLKTLYSYVVDFNNTTDRLLLENNNQWGIDDFKRNINKWNRKIVVTYSYYQSNKILFPKIMNNSLDEYFEKIKLARRIILKHKKDILETEEYMNYSSVEEEFEYTREKLELFRETAQVNSLPEKSLAIKLFIEKSFRKILKDVA